MARRWLTGENLADKWENLAQAARLRAELRAGWDYSFKAGRLAPESTRT